MKLRNLVTNGSANSGVTTGWAPTRAAIVAEPGVIPVADGRRHFRVTATAVGTGTAAQRVDVAASVRPHVIPGEQYTVSAYMRTINSTRSALLQVIWLDGAGAQVGTSVPSQQVTGATWQRPSVSGVAPAGATTMLVRLGSFPSDPWQVGNFFDYGMVLTEQRSEVGTYFDGDTPDTPLARYEWDDTPHASPSTATITTIDAHLLDTGAPNPVQIVVQDLAPGSEYTIRGHRGDFTWTVPGGIGTSDGSQIVLIDNRAPLNAPITYTLTVGGASVSTEPLTVTHQGKFVLQPLNGQNALTPKQLLKGPGARDLDMQIALFNVAGRSRPIVRYDKTGMGGSSFSILCTRPQSAELMGMLETGRPLVYRVTIPSDVPSMETIAITSATSEAMPHDGDRIWNLGFAYINDPEPNRVLAAFTWADFNQIYAGQTWADFNAEWAGEVWADFNSYDWGQRT